jgi:hypothetical protein
MADAPPGGYGRRGAVPGLLRSVPRPVRRDHLRLMARRRGLLMTGEGLTGPRLVVTGLGDQIVVATPQRVRRIPARAIARVPRIMAAYAARAGRLETGAWDAGDLALLLGPGAEPGDVLLVDDEEWHVRPEGDLLVPAEEPPRDLVLEETSWELAGGSGSPGTDDAGRESLVRLGPCFLRWQGALGSWDLLDVAGEEEARALVREWDRVSAGGEPEE